MVREVADGVRVGTSGWVASNAVLVDGATGVLVVDPGIVEAEIQGLVDDLDGRPVVAGFATHPHWDHLLWHRALGSPPRWATARAADTARTRLASGIDRARFGIPDEVSLDLVGDVEGLPAGTASVPWDGPETRVIEHEAHAPGHAALVVRGVLVAGDMLSDVLVPMLDVRGATDPIGDHLAALDLLERAAVHVDVVVPGHGSVGDAAALRERIALDRAYLAALRSGHEPEDPRLDASGEWEWVRGVHEGQVAALAARG